MVFETEIEGFQGRHVYYSLISTAPYDVNFESVLEKHDLNFTAIDANMICGLNSLLVACMKTINREETGKKFISGNINREIVYSLSPTKNLKEALKLFLAKKDSLYVLLVSLECADGIIDFIKENNIKEELTVDYLDNEKSEDVKAKLIEHFNLSKEELNIYPLIDLIQMGIKLQKQQDITLMQLQNVIKTKLEMLKNDEIQINTRINSINNEICTLLNSESGKEDIQPSEFPKQEAFLI